MFELKMTLQNPTKKKFTLSKIIRSQRQCTGNRLDMAACFHYQYCQHAKHISPATRPSIGDNSRNVLILVVYNFSFLKLLLLFEFICRFFSLHFVLFALNVSHQVFLILKENKKSIKIYISSSEKKNCDKNLPQLYFYLNMYMYVEKGAN